MDIAVGDILMHALLNRAAVDQCFQIFFGFLICLPYHLTNDAVGRSVRPVRQCKLRHMVFAVIDIF